MWDDFDDRLNELRRAGRYRELRGRKSTGVYLIDGDGKRLINFGSNDYLGLSSFVATQLSIPAQIGSTASGLVCGWTDRHQLLADKIAAFEQTETAVLFPSGFAACSGTVATLCRDRDLILSDELNHASLIDGCRLSKARCEIYPHRDVESVRQSLAQQRSTHQRAWIVTDSVFSMDGHVAPLVDLVDVAGRYDATLIVDEAHATGILGATASGACEAFGLKEQIPIRVGTLSKAFGSQGGFVACPKTVAEYLINHCRPLIFSTALALPAVEAALMVLDQPERLRQRQLRVCSLARQLRQRLSIDSPSPESDIPIIPIPIGSDSAAVQASNRLRELGMFVPAIRPPTVPEGQARLRISLSADHSDDMIDRLAGGLRAI